METLLPLHGPLQFHGPPLFATAFGLLDTAIVVGYLIATLAIGLLAGRLIRGMATFVVAGRGLGTALSVAAMTGSELGLITVMYQAEKGFTGGLAALHIALVAGAVTLVVGLSGFIVVPLRRMGVLTIPEFYGKRFGPRTRLLGGVLLATGGILNMGIFLKVGADFVVGVTDLEPQGGTLILIMVVLLGIVLIYTVLGGMVAVVLTEYVQFCVLSLGLLALTWVAWDKIGWDPLVATMTTLRPGGGALDPTVAESGFGPSYMTWQAVLGLVSCAIWPPAVARALAARDVGVVRKQFSLSAVSFMIRFLIPCFVGACAVVWVMQMGGALVVDGVAVDQVPTGSSVNGWVANAATEVTPATLQKTTAAFPQFVADLLPVGLLGLVVAGMLAAFMSTHSNYLLCWASVLSRDVLAPICGRQLDERWQVKWTRVLVVVLGGYVLFWGLFYEPDQAIWDYLGITGAIYFTGAIAVLVGGLYWKRTSSAGAIAAMLTGFSALLGLGPIRSAVGIAKTDWLGSSWNLGLATVAASLIAMVVISLLFPDNGGPGAEEVTA